MKRWIHSPRLSIALLVVWLLLNQSIALADILIGLVLAVLIPVLLRPLTPCDVRIRKPLVIVRLITGSLIEIVRSCFSVSALILFTKRAKLNSQFITIPLDLCRTYWVAALSYIINSILRTVTVEFLHGSHALAMHVLDY